MKTFFKSCLVFTILFSCQSLFGQINLDKKQEIRFSIVGQPTVGPSLDNNLDWLDFYSEDLTLTYLRKIKEGNTYFKSSLSVRPGLRNTIFDQDISMNDSRFRYAYLYLGLEKQYAYEHWGLFYSAGVFGGQQRFQGDFLLQDERFIQDYLFVESQIGLRGDATWYTNLSDNLYLFVTTSMRLFIRKADENQDLTGEEVETGSWNADFSTVLLDGVGLAYKF